MHVLIFVAPERSFGFILKLLETFWLLIGWKPEKKICEEALESDHNRVAMQQGTRRYVSTIPELENGQIWRPCSKPTLQDWSCSLFQPGSTNSDEWFLLHSLAILLAQEEILFNIFLHNVYFFGFPHFLTVMFLAQSSFSHVNVSIADLLLLKCSLVLGWLRKQTQTHYPLFKFS